MQMSTMCKQYDNIECTQCKLQNEKDAIMMQDDALHGSKWYLNRMHDHDKHITHMNANAS